jgi:hypothetical protein
MVAPGYSATRKELALKSGLGRKPAATPAKAPTKPRAAKAAPKPRKTLGIKAALDAGREFLRTQPEPTA